MEFSVVNSGDAAESRKILDKYAIKFRKTYLKLSRDFVCKEWW